MLKISRKSEYAIIALKYMHSQPISLYTAREISEKFAIPMELMAKILQSLARANFIKSIKGSHGGYTLERDPSDISIGDVVEAIDGPVGIVECASGENISCKQYHMGVCNIYDSFHKIQGKFQRFLKEITLSDLS